ncbi:D-aminoacyl-tRNA deacylase [Chloroflexota bacterium]
MRVLLQRVSRASVSVEGAVVGSIGPGLTVFVGVAEGDTSEEVVFLAQKMVGLRIFGGENGKFDLCALDVNAELLLISQFTLFADTKKGRRPSFIGAAESAVASETFNYFTGQCVASGLKVATGVFGQHMVIELINDGPVSIWLDTRDYSPEQIKQHLKLASSGTGS